MDMEWVCGWAVSGCERPSDRSPGHRRPVTGSLTTVHPLGRVRPYGPLPIRNQPAHFLALSLCRSWRPVVIADGLGVTVYHTTTVEVLNRTVRHFSIKDGGIERLATPVGSEQARPLHGRSRSLARPDPTLTLVKQNQQSSGALGMELKGSLLTSGWTQVRGANRSSPGWPSSDER